MITKYLLTVYQICFVFNLAFSQSDTSEFLNWCAGIVRDTGGYHAEIINFPKQELHLYDKDGKSIGVLFSAPASSNMINPYWWLRAYLNNNSTTYTNFRNDCIEVTYEGVCLKYYERNQQFIRVLHNVIPDPPVYLKISDIERLGYEIVDWKEFIGISRKGWRRFDHHGPPLTLRESPSLISKPILSFHGNLYVIEIIGPWKGSWVYVEIMQYSKFDMILNERDIQHRYRGWIKALDERGFPNIWFTTRD